MKPCKYAYKQVRDNSSEIFKGFGFKHLSDATQYYVHLNNQSYKGTTTLCQPIGEAVMLMAEFVTYLMEEKESKGDILYYDGAKQVYMDIPVPEDWRTSGVTGVYSYRAYMDNTSMIRVAAYDKDGSFIVSNPNIYYEEYKLLPVLCVMLAHYILKNDDYAKTFIDFADFPDAESFVNVHEDFYQEYKNNEYLVSYMDINSVPRGCDFSFKEKYAVMRENKAAADKIPDIPITPFEPSLFFDEYRSFIPDLSAEFILPKNLQTVSNAIVTGDVP